MDVLVGLVALAWRLAMFVCFVVLIAVSITLWNASQSEDRVLARSAPSVVSWVLLSLSAALAWGVLVVAVILIAGGYSGLTGVVVLGLLLVGPVLYIRVGYRCVQKIKSQAQES